MNETDTAIVTKSTFLHVLDYKRATAYSLRVLYATARPSVYQTGVSEKRLKKLRL